MGKRLNLSRPSFLISETQAATPNSEAAGAQLLAQSGCTSSSPSKDAGDRTCTRFPITRAHPPAPRRRAARGPSTPASATSPQDLTQRTRGSEEVAELPEGSVPEIGRTLARASRCHRISTGSHRGSLPQPRPAHQAPPSLGEEPGSRHLAVGSRGHNMVFSTLPGS